MPSGAILLGPDVVCDGFVREAKARVQSHIHRDHMYGFETSKGLQQIIASKATAALLEVEYDADLPYRSNIWRLDFSEDFEVGTTKVALIPSGHMLGAAQVIAQLANGMRVGYSGDFQWPLDNVIEVEALVVDSTYGSPNSVREFTQAQCEEQFAQLIRRLTVSGPVHIHAHRGTLQRALQVIDGELGLPVIGSKRLLDEVNVYRQFGYTIGEIVLHSSDEAMSLREEGRYIRVYGTGDQSPVDIGSDAKIVLSAYFTRPDEPVVEYSERAFSVALSNHADFSGTLEYVRATRAKFVVTDNSRGGKGYELAQAIASRLGIEARPSSAASSREWGGTVPEL